jgi:hypothetical protein
MSEDIKTIDLTKIGLGDVKIVEDVTAASEQAVVMKPRDSPVYMHRNLPTQLSKRQD